MVSDWILVIVKISKVQLSTRQKTISNFLQPNSSVYCGSTYLCSISFWFPLWAAKSHSINATFEDRRILPYAIVAEDGKVDGLVPGAIPWPRFIDGKCPRRHDMSPFKIQDNSCLSGANIVSRLLPFIWQSLWQSLVPLPTKGEQLRNSAANTRRLQKSFQNRLMADALRL